MSKSLSIREFFKRFPDDDTCLEHVMEVRYGLQGKCPKCERENVHFYRLRSRPAYSCEFCGHHVYPCSGTPFNRTRTPLQLWFFAIYLFTTTRHGVSAKELQRQLGVTYKTAWRMGHEIRKHMADTDGNNPLSGHVEIDETYVGGKDDTPGLPTKERGSNKTAMLGLVERDGDVITAVIPDRKTKTLLPKITLHVKPGSRVSTDELNIYKKRLTGLGYQHGYVNHGSEEYVNGDIHTNIIEGFWSHFKCSVRGTHRAISPQHMMNYLGEFEYRFNRRRDVFGAMFDRLIAAF